jgi:hypothetical protein
LFVADLTVSFLASKSQVPADHLENRGDKIRYLTATLKYCTYLERPGGRVAITLVTNRDKGGVSRVIRLDISMNWDA